MTTKKKKVITNIIFYTLIVFIYSFVLFGVITKFTGGAVYLGNNRMDVVLTNSMSYKNENHLDFLEGTTQIQPFDIVTSSTINKDSELFVKDVVLFRSPNYHNQLVVHRIIGIEETGNKLTITRLLKEQFNNQEMMRLDATGLIRLTALDFTKIEIDAYTDQEYAKYLIMQSNAKNVEPIVETTKISDNLYHHHIYYEKNNNFTYVSVIGNYSLNQKVYIASVTYHSDSKGATTITANDVTPDDKGNVMKFLYPYNLYEIRADTAYSSDGKFTIEQLISRVHTVTPKLGHVFRFLQSIPGIIMMVGLAIIITVASFLLNKEDKKHKLETSNNEEIIDNQSEEKKKESLIDKNNDDKSDNNSV